MKSGGLKQHVWIERNWMISIVCFTLLVTVLCIVVGGVSEEMIAVGLFIGVFIGMSFLCLIESAARPLFYSHDEYAIRRALTRGELPPHCVNYGDIEMQKTETLRDIESISSYVKACPKINKVYLDALKDAKELVEEYDKILAFKPKE